MFALKTFLRVLNHKTFVKIHSNKPCTYQQELYFIKIEMRQHKAVYLRLATKLPK